MTKQQLRQKYLALRRSLSPREVSGFSLQILHQFQKHFHLKPGQKVHIFLPIAKFREIDTLPFIEWFWQNGQQVFVPKVVRDQMISLEITEKTTLALSEWGIPEPAGEVSESCNFDFVLTPLVYADGNGHRIGYGKGFYDRFFESLSTPTVKIGLSIFRPNEIITNVGPHDIRLDYLMTPDATLSFGTAAG